jgi:hypothetical protein
MNTRKLESSGVGRPPADKPRNVQIAYRVDEETAKAIDAEIATEQRPGLTLSRNDMARMLMAEALEARQQKRGKKSKH